MDGDAMLSSLTHDRLEDNVDRKYLTKKQVDAFVQAITEGTMFSVVFEKKDGTLRRMVCRQGVTSHLKGGDPTYNGKGNDADNIGVFDTEANGYRCFNGNRVLRVKGGGAKLEACAVGDIEDPIVNARGEAVNVD